MLCVIDVIFPVDYLGKSNMSMEFELNQIKYLQRCEVEIFFLSQISKLVIFKKCMQTS